MLKIAAQSVTPRLIACISSCQNAATQKYLSQSQTQHKRYTVKDHYDFDQKVINSDVPVIVNFHAEWCDPCKILTPKMAELLENSADIDLAIVDVDENADLVETFEVKAVPAVLAFRNGVVIDKFIGLVDANSIEVLIGKLKAKKAAASGGENVASAAQPAEADSKKVK